MSDRLSHSRANGIAKSYCYLRKHISEVIEDIARSFECLKQTGIDKKSYFCTIVFNLPALSRL